MLEVTRKLVDLLDLSPIGDDHFQGDSEDLGFPNVFGGQVLGQALMAASRTVEGRQPHSLHAYFLRPGNHSMPIDYEVQRVRDGGSFSVRRVIARQGGKEILTGSMSFQVAEDGFEHQLDMPSAPDPEGLKSEQERGELLAPHVPEHLRDTLTRDRPIEIRPVDPVNPLKPEPRPPYKQSWFRTQGHLPDDPVLHCCLLTYASDFSFLGTSLNPHGVSFMNKRCRSQAWIIPSGFIVSSVWTSGCSTTRTAPAHLAGAASIAATFLTARAGWWRRPPRKPSSVSEARSAEIVSQACGFCHDVCSRPARR